MMNLKKGQIITREGIVGKLFLQLNEFALPCRRLFVKEAVIVS